MKIIEVDNIKDFTKNSIFIGMGTTAKCYLRPDNYVVKIYRNNYYTNELFARVDMLERLKDIGELQNDTYIGPEIIMVQNGKVIGYIFPYVDAKTLHTISLKTTIFDLFNRIDKLLEDTQDISDKGFRLFDVHYKNILFDGEYHVIDLDKGKLVDDKHVFTYNMNSISNTLVGHMFNVDPWEILKFEDEELQDLYRKTIWTSEESIYDFFRGLAEKSNEANPSIKQLRRKIDYSKCYNEYYKY